MSIVGSGTLIVKPISAKLTHDTEFLGKMDPYCKVTLGNQCKRTREHTDAGMFCCEFRQTPKMEQSTRI